ncbi:MAG: hypothetical protein NT178_10795 [Proteobacteria bacterium]|nr:hypothetical protein [Pseudomonadota bacterium]
MEQSAVEKVINDIKVSGTMDDSLNAFQQLSKNDKVMFLTSLRGIKDETAGVYLNALYTGETDKDIQKQMRRLLFTLKTLGIKTEEPKVAAGTVLKRVEEVREHRALMSNYDIEHMRLIVASYGLKKNNFIFFNAALHFSNGLFKLTSGPVDKAGIKNIMKEHPGDTKGNMTMVDISPVYAGYLLEEAAARSGKHKEEINKLNQFIATITNNIRKPKDIYNLIIPETTRSLPIEKILQHPVFEPFSLDWKNLKEDKKTYNNIGGGSAIILPPYMVEEKKHAFIAKLLESEELKSKIPLIKRLLEDYAYIFHGLNEFPYYKGLTECLQDKDVSQNVLTHFTKKVFDKSEVKQPGLIKNPYG